MGASDPIKPKKTLAARGPSTYGSRIGARYARLSGTTVLVLIETYAGPLGMSENRVSHATGPMLAATISKAASAPSSKLPRLANW